MKESDIFIETFDKFKTLLDAKKYSEVKLLMETYLTDETKLLSDIKTVLVITKAFKENEEISYTIGN